MTLLEEYRQNAFDHGKFSIDGNYKEGNKAYNKLNEVFISIINAGQRKELFQFYHDSDLNVQLWAAAHTLEVDETRALQKLRELESAKIPDISFDAEYTIKEWLAGNLHFPPRKKKSRRLS